MIVAFTVENNVAYIQTDYAPRVVIENKNKPKRKLNVIEKQNIDTFIKFFKDNGYSDVSITESKLENPVTINNQLVDTLIHISPK